MALIDFHQLVLLYRLTRCDPGILSSRSHPPPMPAATPSRSRPPSNELDKAGSSISSPTQSAPNTLGNDLHPTPFVRDQTPLSDGTSIVHKLRPDPDRAQKYSSDKYGQYIVQDFEHHRVFVDIDVFMENVLHVPDDWREEWGEAIAKIKRNRTFVDALTHYTDRCNTSGTPERDFYRPLVNTANAILDFSESSPYKCIKPQTPQRCVVNDPKKIRCGVINNLSPDIVAVHRDFLPHLDDEQGLAKKPTMTWAHPLQVLEVKPWDNALVDGSCMPRLMVNGRDPQESHARACTPSRYTKKTSAGTDPCALDGAASAPELASTLKRPAEEPHESTRKTAKPHHQSTPGDTSRKVSAGRPQTHETDHQKDAYLQVGWYLLEQFSIPAFRSHATVGLVDRNRIQFYHANHSVVLVSSAIAFSIKDDVDGLDRFIAIVIAFGRLSLRDNGILYNLRTGNMFHDNERLPKSKLPPKAVRIQEGNQLELGGGKKKKRFTVTYGEVISHEPSLAGRATAVLHATSPRWKGRDLVVKISWPGSGRVAENKLVHKAVEKANKSADDRWALNHLPRVRFAQDVSFRWDSTNRKVAKLFDNAEFVNGEYKYERLTLRIIIQDRLYPLKTLTNARDVGQVLVDVGCVHRWLYECAGILHRDLSPSNIMYRMVEEKVCGVLTDFDLGSWTKDLAQDYTRTSQQRTGTPPYMAYGLLDGSDDRHLYRHDLESLFYIVLIVVTHYEIQLPTKGRSGGLCTRQGFKELPYQCWFDQPSYRTLAALEQAFFSNLQRLSLSPAFEDFRDWLRYLHLSFRRGIRAKEVHEEELTVPPLRQNSGSEDKDTPMFDDETLGGHVDYSALIDPVRRLKGNLEGLIIRYDPPPLTSTG